MFQKIVSELASFGLTDVRISPIEDTRVTAVRITDFVMDHATTEMVAREIIQPLGVSIHSFASNSLYEGDEAIGSVIHVMA